MTLNNDRIKWYKTPIEKEMLQKLTKKSDAKGFKQVSIQILVTAFLAFLVFYFFKNKYIVFSIIAYYIYASIYGFMGGAGAGHELSHKTVFKTKWINELFMVLFSLLTYFEFSYFRASHKHHHQFTLHKNSDLEVVLPMKFSRKTYLMWSFFDFYKFFVVFKMLIRHSLNIFDTDWEKHIFYGRDEKYKVRAKWWARLVLIFHLLIVIVSIITGNIILIFLITLAPFFATGLNNSIGITQHVGLSSDVDDFRLCCRSTIILPIWAFFYWQMNYHIEHHMYAGVPFYNLKNLRKEIVWDLPKAKKGVVNNIKELLKIKDKQKLDPNYVYIPELPTNKK